MYNDLIELHDVYFNKGVFETISNDLYLVCIVRTKEISMNKLGNSNKAFEVSHMENVRKSLKKTRESIL